MRVADRTTARNYLKYLNKAKADYTETNQRIASGNRFVRLSDDVSAGTRVLRTRTDLYKAEKQHDNVKSINEEMSTTESAMMSISDVLIAVHGDKIVKAETGTTGEAGRKAIANEVKAMRDEILQFANTKYGKRYVFGGSNASLSAPFSMNKDGKLLYNGIDVDLVEKRTDGSYFYKDGTDEKDIPMNDEIFMDIGLGIRMPGSKIEKDTAFKLSYSGLEVLGFGKAENGKSNNIYNILTEIEKNIRDYDTDKGAKDRLSEYDTQLVARTDAFGANLTDIGAKTNFLDTMEARLKTSVDSQKIRIDVMMGTNDEEEATNQTMNEYVLKAVLQMGSRILPVSLMDFLR